MAESTVLITTKRIILAVILDVLITGVGHMSIGHVKRGIIILLSAIAITIGAFFLLHFPFSTPVILGFWIWQLYDLSQIIRKMNKRASEKTNALNPNPKTEMLCQKCHSINANDSAYCIRCGSALN